MAKTEMVKVRSLLPAQSIAFHEFHEDHPNGEALVKTSTDGETPEVEVAETRAVVDAIRKKRIEVVETKKAPASKKAPAKKEDA